MPDCSSITQQLTAESGRFLSEEVYRRVIPVSPIVALINKDTFPEGMGEVISNLTYGRVAPTDAVPTWTTVTDDTADGGCLPTAATIDFGSIARTFNLQKRAVNGPDFCVEGLRTKFALMKQLDSIAAAMSQYARIEWEIRYRTEYMRLCQKKVVCLASGVAGNVSTGATFNNVAATTQLTQGILNYYRGYLIRDGAIEGALGMRDGGPILTLVCSPEVSESLIFQNADVRQDIRWGKPSELLAPFGVERDYRGFYHLIDHFTRHYNFAGTYTEVAAWVNQAATKGNESVLNSSWYSAGFDTSYIFDRTVMTSRIPKPITSPGGGQHFDAMRYLGQFDFKNILSKDCNPDGSIIFPRAVFASGSEPVRPERGVAFLSLRCDPAVGAIMSCT